MKHSSRVMMPILAGLFLLVVLPGVASACSVCMGANSKTGGAINDAIFLMLGFVALMLSGITAFIFTLRKRARIAMSEQENAK